jgi:hypothetical protein
MQRTITPAARSSAALRRRIHAPSGMGVEELEPEVAATLILEE